MVVVDERSTTELPALMWRIYNWVNGNLDESVNRKVMVKLREYSRRAGKFGFITYDGRILKLA